MKEDIRLSVMHFLFLDALINNENDIYQIGKHIGEQLKKYRYLKDPKIYYSQVWRIGKDLIEDEVIEMIKSKSNIYSIREEEIPSIKALVRIFFQWREIKLAKRGIKI